MRSLAAAQLAFTEGHLFGPPVGWVEEIEKLRLEVGRRQAVGDEDDAAVRRVLRGEKTAGQLQPVLDVREVRRDVKLADLLVAHVGPELHHGVIDGYGLGHQPGDLAYVPRLGEGVEFHELEIVAGYSRRISPSRPAPCA